MAKYKITRIGGGEEEVEAESVELQGDTWMDFYVYDGRRNALVLRLRQSEVDRVAKAT